MICRECAKAADEEVGLLNLLIDREQDPEVLGHSPALCRDAGLINPEQGCPCQHKPPLRVLQRTYVAN